MSAASPVTGTAGPKEKDGSKSESLLEYLGTIGRRKKIREGQHHPRFALIPLFRLHARILIVSDLIVRVKLVFLCFWFNIDAYHVTNGQNCVSGVKTERVNAVEELQKEGKEAIDGSLQNPTIDSLPEEFVLGQSNHLFPFRSRLKPLSLFAFCCNCTA